MINDSQLKQLIEAALFAAGEALSIDQLQQGVLSAYKLNRPRIRQVIDQLMTDYQERGVCLVEVASGYRFQTRPELAGSLSAMWQDKAPRYSAALLETLALIAWRQPITRGEIEAVRGVTVSTQIMRTLQERGWVKIVGQKEVPGRPSLYATTRAFLDYFSLQSIADLPALAQQRPELTALAQGAEQPSATELSTESDTRERDETKAILH